MRVDHVRAGVPVLAQADRARVPAVLVLGAVPGRRAQRWTRRAADVQRRAPPSTSRTDVVVQVAEPVTLASTGTVDRACDGGGPCTLARRASTTSRPGTHADASPPGAAVPDGRRAPRRRYRGLAPARAPAARAPAARDLLADRWRRSWARWACRTCWCASTPTRTAGRPGDHARGARLLGVFYLFPTLYGRARAGCYVPHCWSPATTDAAVLLLPDAALGGGWPAQLLAALVAAGAFAAFLSTSSGLLRQHRRGAVHRRAARAGCATSGWPRSSSRGRCRSRWRWPCARLDFSRPSWPLAFAVAASTFCPLLVLGHLVARADRRSARPPACSSAASLATAAVAGQPVRAAATGGWPALLLGYPAACDGAAGVRDDGPGQPADPARGPARRRPHDPPRLHAPERLGIRRSRLTARGADAPCRHRRSHVDSSRCIAGPATVPGRRRP